MKKIFIFAALCAVILVFTASCGDGIRSNRLDLDYPLEFHGHIKFDGNDYEGDITVKNENNMSISFTAPDKLKNTVLEMNNGECFIHVYGISIPINDGGYASENGLLLIRSLLNIPDKSHTGTNVIKSSGVKYSVENYVTSEGKISVYFASGKDMPEKIYATIRGHEIELIIVN